MKKNNAWNIRRLVDESFDPASQRIILKIVRFLKIDGFMYNDFASKLPFLPPSKQDATHEDSLDLC